MVCAAHACRLLDRSRRRSANEEPSRAHLSRLHRLHQRRGRALLAHRALFRASGRALQPSRHTWQMQAVRRGAVFGGVRAVRTPRGLRRVQRANAQVHRVQRGHCRQERLV